jgi:hypothetical protein
MGCGQLSVRREAANHVTISCWYQRRCGAWSDGWCESTRQWLSVLGYKRALVVACPNPNPNPQVHRLGWRLSPRKSGGICVRQSTRRPQRSRSRGDPVLLATIRRRTRVQELFESAQSHRSLLQGQAPKAAPRSVGPATPNRSRRKRSRLWCR